MVHLLRRQAWEQIEAENPALAAVIRAGVAAGRDVADILDDCRAIEPDPDILAGAGTAIRFLREEEMRAILRREEWRAILERAESQLNICHFPPRK